MQELLTACRSCPYINFDFLQILPSCRAFRVMGGIDPDTGFIMTEFLNPLQRFLHIDDIIDRSGEKASYGQTSAMLTGLKKTEEYGLWKPFKTKASM